jgi:hypothetical protein
MFMVVADTVTLRGETRQSCANAARLDAAGLDWEDEGEVLRL